MKIVLAPDSYKGTMSSTEICEIMRNEIKAEFPECEIMAIPIADGGEGTVDSFLYAAGGKKITLRISGPYFNEVESFYGLINNGKTAVIEMAAAAGLPMVGERKDPSITTTFGLGQLVLHALEHGAKDIVVGLGGSCTNDCGCGMAAALGVKFYNRAGKEFIPVGGTLDEVERIDVSSSRKKLDGVRLRAMCDVDNPLYGENGAAYIFAPQKGADEEMTQILDRKLRCFGEILEQIVGEKDACLFPGAGAAGGLGAGMKILLQAETLPGIEAVLDAVNFDGLLLGCDMVFTGEGRIDGQSLRGKAVMGIACRAKRKNVPVIAVVGDSIDESLDPAYDAGVTAVFTINRMAIPFTEAKPRAKTDLCYTMCNISRMLKAV